MISFDKERGSVKISKSILSFLCAFATDIRQLCPLSKLRGLQSEVHSSLRLPN